MGPAIVIRSLVRRFGQRGETGLTGVDLEVRAGECLAVLGPSGGGKSTLMRLIAGLDQPDEGSIRFDGRDVLAASPAGRGIGMSFDDAALYEHLDARRNIALALDREGLRGAARDEAILRAARLVAAESILDRRADALSSGERRRIALARAIARRPGVLLLDEPLGHLDRAARWDLRDDLRHAQRALGATTMVVTHEHDDAIAIADRIAFLARGRIVQVGSADDLAERPADVTVAIGFGAAPMNILRQPDGAGWIGIRPASIEVATSKAFDGWCEEAQVEDPGSTGALAVARIPSGERVRFAARESVGKRIWLHADPDSLHRFAPDGVALR